MYVHTLSIPVIILAILTKVRARDRQDAIVGWMRARGSCTVEALAERFGVSVRTIHRDLAELRARGVAVDGEPGRGGGLRIDPGRNLPPVRLELQEVIGLVLAVSLARHETTLPFGGAARSAVDKVIASLPQVRARDLRRLLSRVWIGAPASSTVQASLGPIPATVLERFEETFHRRRQLGFRYVDRHGRESARGVEPHGLLLQAPAWYLLAHDLDRDAPRMFRLDRMSRPYLRESEFRPRPLHLFDALIDDAVKARSLF